jgi:hypothetical protein
MSNKKRANGRINPHTARESIDYEPPGWLSTEELEHELFLAVVADSNLPRAQTRLQRIDDYFAADKPETEVQYRRSLLRLLAGLRPLLAELVGGPRKYE